MARTSVMAATMLVLALVYSRQASAFVAPPPASATRDVVMHLELQDRLKQPSGFGDLRKRRVQGLSMAATSRGDDFSSKGDGELGLSSGIDCGSRSSRSRSRSRSSSGTEGASTRLEFGAGLGAAAAAVVLGGSTASAAFAEDASTATLAGDGAASSVAADLKVENAEGATPTAAAAPAETRPLLRDMGFEVPYTGKSYPLSKFLGSRATLVVNPKIDDPESLHQMPGITKLASEYSKEGLNVLLFPTDQGTFEADEDRVVRIKFYQFYGFGQFPKAVVFDKIDIVGNTIHPFYRYLCRSLKNPNGIARITLNYEKFLLDKDGVVLRRYPRKLEAGDFEADVKAVLAGDPLPTENRDYKLSWLKAEQEAIKSEYAFKLGLNYYNN